MNYEGFMVLHDKLKQGIQEYITNNNNRTEYSPSSVNQSYSFCIPNGEISTEIRLVTALRYFLTWIVPFLMELVKPTSTDLFGQSCMQPTFLHHYNFDFQQLPKNVSQWLMTSHSGVKQDLIIVLVASMECYSGRRNLFRSTARR